MKTVILVCLFGSAFCQHWGTQVYDTPEVAAAQASHLAALAKAHQAAQENSWRAQDRSWKEDDGSYKEENDDGSWKEDDESWKSNERSWAPQTHSWTSQPQSWSSPQVHAVPQGHWDAPQKKWTGPVALPPGYDKHGAPLQVLDTPEVAAEKAKHFHLYTRHGAHAASHATPLHSSPNWVPQTAPTTHYGGAYLADTPDVAAAKAAHFAAHAERRF